MTTHVLVGYGYCASYLAKTLLDRGLKVVALSRQKPSYLPPNLKHITIDIGNTAFDFPESSILYYFVPPLGDSIEDLSLRFFLSHLKNPPLKVIYVGSSGIYGDHQGHEVKETSPCYIKTKRQQQRQNHEQQFMQFASKQGIPCALLRTSGIFGPHRLPLEAVKAQTPVIFPEQAPLINHIDIFSLANILMHLGLGQTYHGILNIADGNPKPMGYIQQQCALLMNAPPAPYLSFSECYAQASPFKREFMEQNKYLSIQRLQQLLSASNIHLPPIEKAIAMSLKNMHDKSSPC